VPATTTTTTTATTTTDAEVLARLRDFGRRLTRGASERSQLHPFGEAFFTDALRRMWVLNELRVDADAQAAELAASLDELYAHVRHRRATIEVEALATRLAPAFAAAGWQVQRNVLMVLRRERDRPPVAGLAREAGEDELRAVEAQTIVEHGDRDPELVAELLAGRAAFADAGRARYFVGAVDGVDACHATLYSDGVVAQVEDVGTIERFRGRGLARAVCCAAIDAALAAGHEIVFIAADDEDWPKELYGRLGFDTIGRESSFTWPGPAPPVRPS
jgi:GNAT superfamily N-acetyltransferase